MKHRQLSVPRLAIWLMRLLSNESIFERMQLDPMVFASWYSLGESLIQWPDAVTDIRSEQRNKKMSLERSLSLLQKLGGNLVSNANIQDARMLLEGYAVHDWFSSHTKDFKALLVARQTLMGPDTESLVLQMPNELTQKVAEITKALRLNQVEDKVMMLAFTCAVAHEFRDMLQQIVSGRRAKISTLWCSMLDCKEEELRKAFAPTGVLRTSRLLKVPGGDHQIPTLSDFWVNTLAEPGETVFDQLIKELVTVPGAGIPARLADEDKDLAVQILQNSAKTTEKGVNLLMYGADAFEKRGLLGQVLSESEKRGFVLADIESAVGEIPCITYVAQRLLYERHAGNAVLVVEKPGDVLERRPSEYLRQIFGIELDSAHIAPLDQLLLETNPAPTIWAGPGSDNLLEECVARFVFHAPLKKARREERRAQLESYVEELKLNKATKQELLKLEDVSAKQLETALRASRLSGAENKKQREDALVRAVKRSLAALHRDTTPKAKECVTEYSLEYLNFGGKFGPGQILKALKLRPKGSLCLFGPPGTGKTQFVEHMAQQLGQRLIIKRASDLLSKWVGDNEKNIAAMFQEAEAEEAILFLDEADSFLRDRTLAGQAWEVTKVNELLQCMERFTGIFIAATNLFRGLDTAALRRFTFKMELRALNPEQRWSMFVSEAGLKGRLETFDRKQRDSWRGDLHQMHQLAAGDFATVKRQCILLDETLTPHQWIEQLRIECDIKLDSQARGSEGEESGRDQGKGTPPRMVH